MAYDIQLAKKIKKYLSEINSLKVEEKKMFGGITFMVNGKMCVSVSHEKMMCRFDPQLQETVSKKPGFKRMVMKGKTYRGYGYVAPENIKAKKDFEFWVNLCLDFNEKAKSAQTKK